MRVTLDIVMLLLHVCASPRACACAGACAGAWAYKDNPSTRCAGACACVWREKTEDRGARPLESCVCFAAGPPSHALPRHEPSTAGHLVNPTRHILSRELYSKVSGHPVNPATDRCSLGNDGPASMRSEGQVAVEDREEHLSAALVAAPAVGRRQSVRRRHECGNDTMTN